MQHLDLSHELLDRIANDHMPLVLVESPLSAPDIAGAVRNKKFARACMRDCLSRGEAPYASHLLYAQEGLLDDTVAAERALGIHAGLIWGSQASKTVVYEDLGLSSGMKKGIERAQKEGRAVEFRTLGFVPEPTAGEIALETLRLEVENELRRAAPFDPKTANKTLGESYAQQKNPGKP